MPPGDVAPHLVALGSFGRELLHQSDEALFVRLGEFDLDRLLSFLSHGLLVAALASEQLPLEEKRTPPKIHSKFFSERRKWGVRSTVLHNHPRVRATGGVLGRGRQREPYFEAIGC